MDDICFSKSFMPKATLVFPDTFLLSDFILSERAVKMEINTVTCTVKGRFSEQLLLRAQTNYSARVLLIKKTIPQ
jgi:hypothetical protein